MENKKKLIALVIGIILIILIGGLVFYLTSHLTKTTICKGKLDMITTEEVEVISSDEKVKETKTQVTYDYSDYVSDMYPISYYKDYIKNVASREIYATWPADTIRANVLAIMSFTLNRVYTEWSLRIWSLRVAEVYFLMN